VTTEDALLELGTRTAAALSGALEKLCPGASSHETPVVAPDPSAALAGPPVPGLAASVAYVGGVTGGNVFLIPLEAAHELAVAMMVTSPDDPVERGELTDIEQSAVGEAMNQMMAAAAAATSTVLGYSVEISPPQIAATGGGDLSASLEGTAHVLTTAFEVCGHPCRFVPLGPETFVVRMRSALDERGAEPLEAGTELDELARAALRDSLRSSVVRLSAEVGRTQLPVEKLVGLPAGTVVELDREADEPIDVYVNGRRFATGRLELTEGGEWAVRIERVIEGEQATTKKGRW
jgi:flagellar motor switch protein FliN/FliY